MEQEHATSTTLRAADDNDLEWCARLMAASEPWITLGVSLERAKGSLNRAGMRVFVAHQENERLGFVALDEFGLAGAPYLKSIEVAPEARGKGIGSRLLRFAEKHFVGRRFLFLCVSDFNPRARELYHRTGYEFVAELKDHVVEGHSEVLLRKRIS